MYSFNLIRLNHCAACRPPHYHSLTALSLTESVLMFADAWPIVPFALFYVSMGIGLATLLQVYLHALLCTLSHSGTLRTLTSQKN